MSKLYDRYLELKKNDGKKHYLFKSGMFYLFIDEDASFVSEKLGLKITKLNDSINKCGFPVNAIDKYIELLRKDKIKFAIIDGAAPILNSDKYVNNTKISEFIIKIRNIDLNDVSYKEAYNILINFRKVIDKNE
jgi:DNA mismatch repair ATPase MutS